MIHDQRACLPGLSVAPKFGGQSRRLRCRFVTEPTSKDAGEAPKNRTFAELLIDWEGPDASRGAGRDVARG
jgi:hypothetical protein